MSFRRIVFLAVCVGALSTPASAQQNQARTINASVNNQASDALQYLFVTPADAVSWGPDRLGSSTVSAGGRFTFRIPNTRACRFDVRAVFAQGAEDVKLGVNLCASAAMTFDGRSPLPEAQLNRQGPVALFAVRNETRVNLTNLYAVQPNGQDGDDLLGDSILAAGATFTGRVRRGAACRADLKAVFQGAPDQILTGQDLCAGVQVAFNTGTAAAQQAQWEIAVTNRSAATIQTISIRPERANAWGRDLLGSDTISANATFTIRTPRGRACVHDMRITFDGAPEQIRPAVNLCETRALDIAGPAIVTGRGVAKTAPTAANGGGQRTAITVLNEGGRPAVSLFISSSRVSDWGDDRLIANRIAPGGRFAMEIERDNQCNYDIRIVFEGGREERRMRQNICERREIAFGGPNATRIDGGGPATGRRATFVNDGHVAVRELYLTPVSDSHWGDDRLGSETLPRRFRFELRLPQEGGCRWDVRLVYEGGQSSERRDQDLCALQEMAVGRRERPGAVISTGTGFFVSPAGHVLTNHHVVDGCGQVSYTRPGQGRVRLRLIAQDESSDLALLQAEGASGPPVAFRSNAMRPGEKVVLVGYPARSQLGSVNVTEGIISALRGPLGDENRFQYTAPTQPGNSGGPVLDESGLIVGVVVSQIDKISADRNAQNINFGVKPDLARNFLRANGVTPQEETPGEPLKVADILERRNASVLPLDCQE